MNSGAGVSRDRIILLIILSVSIVITYNYFHFIEKPNITDRLKIHDSIISGKAPSPYRYRVLVPYAADWITKLISNISPLSHRNSWILAYIAYDLAAIFLFLLTMYIFLREFHGRMLSLTALLFCCTLLPLSLRDHYYQPWSLIEAWFFSSAFLAVSRKKYLPLLPLTLAASLNRVSGIFIPVIYLASSLSLLPFDRKMVKVSAEKIGKFIVLAAISAVTIIAVRYLAGTGATVHTSGEVWRINTSFPYWAYAIINIILFAGVWWALAVAGIRYSDRFTINMLPVVGLYLVPVAIFGIWKEVRLLLPVYPVILSAGLFYLKRFTEESEDRML